MPPTDNPNPSPFELWRQIYETNERAWNAVLERTVNTPAFAESSGKILETFLSAQKTVRDNMRQYLEQVNLPTREDIARLGELIVSLEEKVDQLDDRLARIESSLAGRGSAAASDSGGSGGQSVAASFAGGSSSAGGSSAPHVSGSPTAGPPGSGATATGRATTPGTRSGSERTRSTKRPA